MEPSERFQTGKPASSSEGGVNADRQELHPHLLRPRGFWLPTLLSTGRIPGAVIVLGLAIAGLPGWFVATYLFFAFTDWLDGRLAVWLDSRSVFGAKMDTIGDLLLSAAMVAGAAWLKWDVLRGELWFIGAVFISYVLSVLFALLKFGRWPIYHTLIAKWSWLFVVVAVFALMLDWSLWPLRLAAVVVTLGNIEAIAITGVLERPQANIWSLRQALRSRR